MPGPDYHAWTHRPKAAGGTDPIEMAVDLPTAYCTTTTNFTATDGSYYGLAQLTGADPSAYGVASSITVWNSTADGLECFRVKDTGGAAPGVLQVFSPTGVPLLMGYDGVVEFNESIDTDVVVATLYMGVGTAGGPLSYEQEFMEKVAGQMFGGRSLRVTGQAIINPGVLNDATTGIPNTPTLSPILIVEGDDVSVTETHFTLSRLSLLNGGEIFTP